MEALEQFAEKGDQQAITAVSACLEDEVRHVRQAAVRALRLQCVRYCFVLYCTLLPPPEDVCEVVEGVKEVRCSAASPIQTDYGWCTPSRVS